MRRFFKCGSLQVVLSGLVFVTLYSCGKDDGGSADDSATAEQAEQGATAYLGMMKLLDFSSNTMIASSGLVRNAVQVAKSEMHRLQEETNLCKTFKSDFCEAKKSSRSGLLTNCETTCEDGKKPTTACTITDNVASSCVGEGDKAVTVTLRRDSSVEVTSSCETSKDKYYLDSDIQFKALLSGDGIEGTVTLECTFFQRNNLTDQVVDKNPYENCESFDCTIDGKAIACEQFQGGAEKSPCNL